MKQYAGFYQITNSKQELIKYENLETMINETIKIIDKIEVFLLTKHLNVKN